MTFTCHRHKCKGVTPRLCIARIEAREGVYCKAQGTRRSPKYDACQRCEQGAVVLRQFYLDKHAANVDNDGCKRGPHAN